MSADYKTKLLLAYRSGDMCAMPGCHQRLTPHSASDEPINVGEVAHISGEHDGKGRAKPSARFDPDMTSEERDHFNNLIYLCRTCHAMIDAIPQGELDFPVERLRAIKASHEAKVRQAVLEAFAEVGFPELQEATKWVVAVQPSSNAVDYSLLRVDEKINSRN